MVARPVIVKAGPWLRRSLFLLLWFLSFLILIIFASTNELNTFYNDFVDCEPQLSPPQNQLGAVRYIRWNPKENHRPVYSMCFKNLRAENNRLGIFKTALHKVVKIRDLTLESYQYPSDKTTASTTPDIYPVTSGTIADAKALIDQIMRKLINPMDGWRIKSIDFGNVSEVQVYNFDYKVLYDDELFFTIRSKRATASYKHSGIVLRGHVTITTAEGSTLESNYVRWDIQKKHFRVNGIYALNRNGVRTTGRDICVDAQLKSVKAQHAEFIRKEEQKCLAKL
jgi:hypothetical protein